ncbi:hypothetical protein D3C78_1678150 [compost metagenome]
MGKALVVFLNGFDSVGAGGNPVPAVVGRPDNIRPIVQGLPGQMDIFIRTRRMHEIEIHHKVFRNMCRHGPTYGLAHCRLHGIQHPFYGYCEFRSLTKSAPADIEPARPLAGRVPF